MKHEIKQDDIKHSEVHQNDTTNVLLAVHFLYIKSLDWKNITEIEAKKKI